MPLEKDSQLEKTLNEISGLHPWKSLVCVTLEYFTLQHQYMADEPVALEYLKYKYDHVSQNKPHTSFLLWYVDFGAAKKKEVERMTRGSEYDKIHRFP